MVSPALTSMNVKQEITDAKLQHSVPIMSEVTSVIVRKDITQWVVVASTLTSAKMKTPAFTAIASIQRGHFIVTVLKLDSPVSYGKQNSIVT